MIQNTLSRKFLISEVFMKFGKSPGFYGLKKPGHFAF